MKTDTKNGMSAAGCIVVALFCGGAVAQLATGQSNGDIHIEPLFAFPIYGSIFMIFMVAFVSACKLLDSLGGG